MLILKTFSTNKIHPPVPIFFSNKFYSKIKNIKALTEKKSLFSKKLVGTGVLLYSIQNEEKETFLEQIDKIDKIDEVDKIESFPSEGKDFSSNKEKLLPTKDISLQISSARDKEMYKNVIHLLNSMKDFDIDLYFHSIRVAQLSEIILDAMRKEYKIFFSKRQRFLIKIAALCHDIGKLFLDINILKKKASFSDEDFQKIKNHVLIGLNYFKSTISNNEFILKGILDHHERFDGSGYPRGISKKLISLQGRIIAVADSYDAIYSKRSYKERKTKKESLEILKKERHLFDKKIINLLFTEEVRKKISKIYL